MSRGAGPSIHFEKSHLMYIAGSAVSAKVHPFTSAPSVSKNNPRPLFEPNLQSTMSTLGKAVAFDTGIPAFAYSGSGFSHVIYTSPGFSPILLSTTTLSNSGLSQFVLPPIRSTSPLRGANSFIRPVSRLPNFILAEFSPVLSQNTQYVWRILTASSPVP